MNIKKAITSLLSIAVLAMAAVGSASAGQTTFASATGAGASASNCFTYTGASGFSITPGATFTSQLLSNPPGQFPTTLNFVGLNNVGDVTGTGTTADPFNQLLSGGSFTLTANGGADLLLAGTFGGGNLLVGTTGSTASTLSNNLTNVVYTGGSYFTASGLSNPGSFSLSMTSVSPAIAVTNGHFNDFKAGGTGTFSATTPSAVVPEPATVVPFVLGGLGLLGLAVRKSRRTSGAAV